MIEVHLRALQKRVREKVTEVLTIDHWNNQTLVYEQHGFTPPAVFIDFGRILWSNAGSGIKSGRATIAVHCAGTNIRPTKDKAEDQDGKRLKRFDLSNKVVNCFENFSAKDCNDNLVIKSMQLTGSEMSTNHDALTDDVLYFDAQLYYYDSWREKDWTEIIILSVDDPYDETIVI